MNNNIIIVFAFLLGIFIFAIIQTVIEEYKDKKAKKQLSYLDFKKYYHKKERNGNINLYVYHKEGQVYKKLSISELKLINRLL